MSPRRAVLALLCASLLLPASAGATLPNDGKRWRVADTTGVTAAQVAAVCSRDGQTRCAGTAGGRDVTGWIWATDAQVIALMGHYEPSILTADPPSVSGPELLFQAMTFVDDLRSTFSFSGYPTTVAFTSGWTASERVDGAALATVGYEHPIFNGSFGVYTAADEPAYYRGAWFWRPATDDITKPVVTPTVTGTLGTQGWYTSNVSVSWSVIDPDSAITESSGCDTATVTADTAGVTFTCSATSGGGTTTVSTTVKRDATGPVITCTSPPQTFELGSLAQLSGALTDAMSGSGPTAQAIVPTTTLGTFTGTLLGVDRAGNRTTKACAYVVAVPPCNGKTATIVGTGANNVINGTAGNDVIVALDGNDTIDGKGGDDTICSGGHVDTVKGGDGKDWIDGGLSNDDLNGGNGDDFLDGGPGSDSLRGDGGRDTCVNWELRNSSCEA